MAFIEDLSIMRQQRLGGWWSDEHYPKVSIFRSQSQAEPNQSASYPSDSYRVVCSGRPPSISMPNKQQRDSCDAHEYTAKRISEHHCAPSGGPQELHNAVAGNSSSCFRPFQKPWQATSRGSRLLGLGLLQTGWAVLDWRGRPPGPLAVCALSILSASDSFMSFDAVSMSLISRARCSTVRMVVGIGLGIGLLN